MALVSEALFVADHGAEHFTISLSLSLSFSGDLAVMV